MTEEGFEGLEVGEQESLESEELSFGELEELELTEEGFEGLEISEEDGLKFKDLELGELAEKAEPAELIKDELGAEKVYAVEDKAVKDSDIYALKKDKMEQLDVESVKAVVSQKDAMPSQLDEKLYKLHFADEALLKTSDKLNELLINFEKDLFNKMDTLFSRTFSTLSNVTIGASLSGDLSRFSITNIINLLIKSNIRGTLYIISSDELTDIAVNDGKIVTVNAGDGRKWSAILGDLKRECALTDKQISEAFETSIIIKRRLEQVFVDKGYASVNKIRILYVRQAQYALNTIEKIKQGKFFFKESDVEIDEFALNMSFDELMSYKSE